MLVCNNSDKSSKGALSRLRRARKRSASSVGLPGSTRFFNFEWLRLKLLNGTHEILHGGSGVHAVEPVASARGARRSIRRL